MIDFLCSIEQAKVDVFISQVSVTFLVISFLAILGGKRETVLWADIVRYKLVSPKFFSFRTITWYCLATLVVSLIALVCSCPWLLIIFYILDVVLLAVLTIKMIQVYFDKDGIKAKLKDSYKKKSVVEKSRVMDELLEISIDKVKTNEFIDVLDNLEFLYENEEYAVSVKILHTFPTEANDWFCRAVDIVNYGNIIYEYAEYEDLLRQYLKRLIMASQGSNTVKKSLIDMYFSKLQMIVENFLHEKHEGILYAASSMNGRACIEADKMTQEYCEKMHKYDKLVPVLQYAYQHYDWDTINLIVKAIYDINNRFLYLLEYYCDQYETVSMDTAIEFCRDTCELLNPDEKEILHNILKEEEKAPRLGISLREYLKDIVTLDYNAGVSGWQHKQKKIEA